MHYTQPYAYYSTQQEQLETIPHRKVDQSLEEVSQQIYRRDYDYNQDTKIITTNSFKKLPPILSPSGHFAQASKLIKSVKLTKEIPNIRNKQRKFAAVTLNALMTELSKPLTTILKNYKEIFYHAHPYEITVAKLTVDARLREGYPPLEELLAEIKSLRASTSRIAKEYICQATRAETAIQANALLEEGKAALKQLYEDSSAEASCLHKMMDLQKSLKRIPTIELNTPTVVLVGSPNVGKSSIVRAISSGTPEVNNYPFTTRGVSLGHIRSENGDQRYQVMDTPGLLDRPEEERNHMEKLTYASMAHLPTAVMFVIDPSETGGEKSSLEAQLNVREALKKRFPLRPWIDVATKCDLRLKKKAVSKLPEGCLQISIKDNENVDALKSRLHSLYQELIVSLEQFERQQPHSSNDHLSEST